MSDKSVRQVPAVFAPEDYSVIRKALQVYLQESLEENEARIVARLLHRLGRIEYE